jgi:hypothetical protein
MAVMVKGSCVMARDDGRKCLDRSAEGAVQEAPRWISRTAVCYG